MNTKDKPQVSEVTSFNPPSPEISELKTKAPKKLIASSRPQVATLAAKSKTSPTAQQREWLAEGKQLESAGKLEEAGKAYSAAVKAEPRNAEAHMNLGVLLEMLGRPEQALEAFERVVELSPLADGAWYNLGRTQASLGQASSAVQSFSRAMEINPDYAEAHLGLGLMYDQIEEGKKAISHTRGAHRLFQATSRKDLARMAQKSLSNLEIKYGDGAE